MRRRILRPGEVEEKAPDPPVAQPSPTLDELYRDAPRTPPASGGDIARGQSYGLGYWANQPQPSAVPMPLDLATMDRLMRQQMDERERQRRSQLQAQLERYQSGYVSPDGNGGYVRPQNNLDLAAQIIQRGDRLNRPQINFTPAMARAVERMPRLTETVDRDPRNHRRFSWVLLQGSRRTVVILEDRNLEIERNAEGIVRRLEQMRHDAYLEHFRVWLDFDRFQAGLPGLHADVVQFGNTGNVPMFLNALRGIGGTLGRQLEDVARETWATGDWTIGLVEERPDRYQSQSRRPPR